VLRVLLVLLTPMVVLVVLPVLAVLAADAVHSLRLDVLLLPRRLPSLQVRLLRRFGPPIHAGRRLQVRTCVAAAPVWLLHLWCPCLRAPCAAPAGCCGG